MARHIAHRLMISLPVLLGVLLIGFLLLQVIPTDPATVVAGPTATRAEVEETRAYLIGAIPRQLETNYSIASFLQMCEQFGLGLDYDRRLPGGEVPLALGRALGAGGRIGAPGSTRRASAGR